MSRTTLCAPFYSPECKAWLWEEMIDGHKVTFSQRFNMLEWGIEGEERDGPRHKVLVHPSTLVRRRWRTDRIVIDKTETQEERLMRWRIAVWKTIDDFKPAPDVVPPFEFIGLIGERPVPKP